MKEILQVRGLRKTFKLSGKQQKLEKTREKVRVAVDDLSFTAYEGEIFGLLGPNGAGKTTTLRMLATLIRPDSGDAYLNGISVVNEPDKVRASIGFLTSELKLEEFFTPNYLFDFFSDLHKVPVQVREARKKELFEKFGIDRFAEVKVANLSTGMKQKVSLVISIVHDPDVIIFDEPTKGVDVGAKQEIFTLINDIAKAGNCVIYATCENSELLSITDRMYVMFDGRVMAELETAKTTEDEIMYYSTGNTGSFHS